MQHAISCPSVGPITATAVVAALDNVHRFAGRRGAAQVTSYLGLVPREYSSGEQQQRGRRYALMSCALIHEEGRTARLPRVLTDERG
jgi:transposase